MGESSWGWGGDNLFCHVTLWTGWLPVIILNISITDSLANSSPTLFSIFTLTFHQTSAQSLQKFNNYRKEWRLFNITHKPIQRIKCCCQVQWELFVEHKGKFGCCLPRQHKWLLQLTPRIKPESTRLDLSQRHSEHEELNATESIQSHKPHVKLWCDQRCHHWRGWPCCIRRCLHC